jgi:hypothetical protein
MRQEKKSDGRETERKKEKENKRNGGKSGRKNMRKGILLYLCNKCAIYFNNYLFLVGPILICSALQTAIGPTRNKIPDTLDCIYSHQIHNDT